MEHPQWVDEVCTSAGEELNRRTPSLREALAQIYTDTPAIEDLHCRARSSDHLAAAREILAAGGTSSNQRVGVINLLAVPLMLKQGPRRVADERH